MLIVAHTASHYVPRMLNSLSKFKQFVSYGICLFASSIAIHASHLNDVSLTQYYSHIQPGVPTPIGITLTLEEGYHTYWKNPGDTGYSLKANWKLPQKTTVTSFEYPLPEQIVTNNLTTFGYHNKVTLITYITVPTPNIMAKTIPIQLSIDWLVCKKSCIPKTHFIKKDILVSNTPAYHIRPLPQPISRQLPTHISLRIKQQKKMLIVTVDSSEENIPQLTGFFSNDQSTIDYSKKPITKKSTTTYQLKSDKILNQISGLFIINGIPYDLTIPIQLSSHESITTLLLMLLLALCGGIVLNLMPCVLPILSLKAFSLMTESDMKKRKHNSLLYTLGIMTTFISIGIIIELSKQTGVALGWGFQLQSPNFVIALIWLFFTLGLNLLGAFEFTISTTQSKKQSSFFMGVLASIVSTPCTAPFMGAALGYGLTQSSLISILIFTCLGLGLGLPYIVLSWSPTLIKWLPKPGNWMNTLKQAFAFPMFATVIWLLWVLSDQIDPSHIVLILVGCLMIAVIVWIPKPNKWLKLTIITISLIYLAALINQQPQQLKSNWQPYSQSLIDNLTTNKKPYFINFTAKWCITCQVNALSLNHPSVTELFVKKNITLIKADWTSKSPTITQAIHKYNRQGVPLYIFYDPSINERPIILPELLTPTIIKSYINPAD